MKIPKLTFLAFLLVTSALLNDCHAFMDMSNMNKAQGRRMTSSVKPTTNHANVVNLTGVVQRLTRRLVPLRSNPSNNEENVEKNQGPWQEVGLDRLNDNDEAPIPLVPSAFIGVGIATAVSWVTVAVQALSFHPDFVTSTAWHNALALAQALVFPIPLWTGVICSLTMAAQRGGWKALEQDTARRFNLAVLFVSVWLAVVARNYPRFAFGLDLLRRGKRLSVIHMMAAGVSWGVWKAAVGATEIYETPIFRTIKSILVDVWKIVPLDRQSSVETSLWATATVGFAACTLLPLVASYPLATLPSILGKRLCRPMAGFYALATVVSFVLKQSSEDDINNNQSDTSLPSSSATFLTPVQRGLWISSAAHVALFVAKVAGIDGGGLWLPGKGLSQNYPALCQVPVTATLTLMPHFAVLFTAWN